MSTTTYICFVGEKVNSFWTENTLSVALKYLVLVKFQNTSPWIQTRFL